MKNKDEKKLNSLEDSFKNRVQVFLEEISENENIFEQIILTVNKLEKKVEQFKQAVNRIKESKAYDDKTKLRFLKEKEKELFEIIDELESLKGIFKDKVYKFAVYFIIFDAVVFASACAAMLAVSISGAAAVGIALILTYISSTIVRFLTELYEVHIKKNMVQISKSIFKDLMMVLIKGTWSGRVNSIISKAEKLIKLIEDNCDNSHINEIKKAAAAIKALKNKNLSILGNKLNVTVNITNTVGNNFKYPATFDTLIRRKFNWKGFLNKADQLHTKNFIIKESEMIYIMDDLLDVIDGKEISYE